METYILKNLYLQQTSNHLVKVLSPSNQFINDPLKLFPKWTTKDALSVIKKLAYSKGGYIYFDEIRTEIAEAKPEAIITAESQVGLLAMKLIVEKEDFMEKINKQLLKHSL